MNLTTTELINLLQRVEHGFSGRSREISFVYKNKKGKEIFISEPSITIASSGDGCAGAQLMLLIEEAKV